MLLSFQWPHFACYYFLCLLLIPICTLNMNIMFELSPSLFPQFFLCSPSLSSSNFFCDDCITCLIFAAIFVCLFALMQELYQWYPPFLQPDTPVMSLVTLWPVSLYPPNCTRQRQSRASQNSHSLHFTLYSVCAFCFTWWPSYLWVLALKSLRLDPSPVSKITA